MRICYIISILILCFGSQGVASDIKNYEVEGMSIGDSLLKFFSEKEIKQFDNYDNFPSDMKFRIAEFNDGDPMSLDIYDAIQFFYKPNDKKYEIYNIAGARDCEQQKCLKLKKEIEKSLRDTFTNIKPKNQKLKHPDDKSGKSTVDITFFEMKNGDISVSHYQWSENVNHRDHVRLSVSTNEAIQWSSNNYGAK